MKGTYVLLVRVGRDSKIRIGRLGFIDFRKGWYAYVGSGMVSLEKRIGRHLKGEKKKHWHIDYLLEEGKIGKVVFWEAKGKEECKVAGKLAERLEGVRKFGCSDCKCKSHLFYSERGKEMERAVRKSVRSLPGPRSPLRTRRAGAS